MDLELRKFAKFVDKTFIEGGKAAKEPVLLVSVAAVIKNPWSEKDFYGKRYLGADISSPRFDKVAELYGAKGFKVTKTSEINRTLKAALKVKKPVVIDIDVDPKALYSFRRDSFKHRVKK